MLPTVIFLLSFASILIIPKYYFLATSFKLRILFCILLLLFFLNKKTSSTFLNCLKKLELLYGIIENKSGIILFIIFFSSFFSIFMVDNPVGDKHGENFGKYFFIPKSYGYDVEFLTLGIPNMITYMLNNVFNFNVTGKQVMITLNSIFGAIGLLFLIKISKLFLSLGPAFLILFIFSGFTEMFYGYWENYTQPLVLIIIFTYFCMKSEITSQNKILSAIILGLAVASHSIVVPFYTTIFLLILLNPNKPFSKRMTELVYCTTITFGIYLTLLIVFYLFGMEITAAHAYSTHATLKNALSLQHYFGIFQEYLTTSGIAFPSIILFFLIKGVRMIKKNKDTLAQSFLGTTIIYSVFMIIYIYSFGYVGSWPMMTPGGFLTTVFISWLIQNYCSEEEKIKILPLLISTNLFFYITVAMYGRTYICTLFC